MHACKNSEVPGKDVERAETKDQGVEMAAANWWYLFSGLLLSVGGGIFSACQFATMSFGKHAARRAAGCEASLSACPSFMQEQFNTFGSYNASFGIGCAIVTSIYYVGAVGFERLQGRAVPPLHFSVMSRWGSLAGILWAAGHFFQLAAVARSGGPAFVQPMNLAIQTIASGLGALCTTR